LVAVDGSEASEAALRFATKLAESESASLVLCNAIDTRDLLAKASDYGYDPAPLYDDMRATAASVIERCSELVRTGHVAYQADVVNGEPARSIVAAARVEGAGTIVVGTHGRAGLERLLAGSVAEGVVQYATVPVAVVRTSRAHARVP
jgi:nucleotide-binding universal stress UspA family protein